MPIEIPDSLLKTATTAALEESAARFNIKVTDLPDSARDAVSEAVSHQLGEQLASVIGQVAQEKSREAVSGIETARIEGNITDRLGIGARLAELIIDDPKLLDILKKNARMQWNKY